MVFPQDIRGAGFGITRTVSSSLSVSPRSFNYHSPQTAFPKQLKPFATEDIKVLLLENINQTGHDGLAQQGYQVEVLKTSLPEDQLIEKIRWGRIALEYPSLLSMTSSTPGPQFPSAIFILQRNHI